MFNKNDPLLDSVAKVMKENQAIRNAKEAVNEAFGITDKRHLPYQAHAEYDALVEELAQEALVGGQTKIDVNKNNRLDKQDFKILRSMKKPMKETPEDSKKSVKAAAATNKMTAKNPMAMSEDPAETAKSVQKAAATQNQNKDMCEEEQINEISKKLAGNYIKRASNDLADKTDPEHGYIMDKDEDQIEREAENRRKGIHRAVNKLAKEETLDERNKENKKAKDAYVARVGNAARKSGDSKHLTNVGTGIRTSVANKIRGRELTQSRDRVKEEQIDELSRDTLSRYIKKAKSSSRDAYYGDDAPTSGKRKKGIDLALLKKWGNKEFGTPEPKVKATNEEAVDEATLSAKAARAGKDIGKPGKMFAKIAAKSGERYGSTERGKKVAGAILAKMRKKADMEESAGAPGGFVSYMQAKSAKAVADKTQTQNIQAREPSAPKAAPVRTPQRQTNVRGAGGAGYSMNSGKPEPIKSATPPAAAPATSTPAPATRDAKSSNAMSAQMRQTAGQRQGAGAPPPAAPKPKAKPAAMGAKPAAMGAKPVAAKTPGTGPERGVSSFAQREARRRVLAGKEGVGPEANRLVKASGVKLGATMVQKARPKLKSRFEMGRNK